MRQLTQIRQRAGEGQGMTALTDQQLRLLKVLVQQDLTLKQAAAYLRRSPHTLNKQIADIKRALGTRTMAGTIFQAIQLDLIDPDEYDY